MYVHLRRVGFDPPAGAVEVDDGAVELSLALSIGGTSQRAGGALRRLGRDAGADLGGSGASVSSTSTPPLPIREGSLDPRRRREIHALRRQEARMKRQEKQQKKGICRAGRDGAAPPETACLVDERVAMEAQTQRARVRDRLAREEGGRHSDWRTGEDHEAGSGFVPKTELCPIANANPNPDANPNSGFSHNLCCPSLPSFGLSPLPAMALQYPYPRVQYLPIANGFGFPYMMPCWASGMSPVTGAPGAATNVLQPVACRAFQPFSPVLVDPTAIDGKLGDSGSGKGTGMKRAPSWTASLGSNSSSAISDHQSNSLQATISSTGGTSGSGSGMRSHPSNAHAERPQPQVSPKASNLVQGQLEHSISSHQIDPEANSVEDPCGKRSHSTSPQQRGAPKGDSSCPPPCTPAKLKGSASVDKPVSAAEEPAPPQASSPLHRMPCVSTTGSGPNGKTITGFLYRYTSAEVSIVCVCHGSSFSPAEFVKHAGGRDTGNPLRHIMVVTS